MGRHPAMHNEPQDADRAALVVGSNGIVGSNMLRHLAKNTRWKLAGLARRPVVRDGITSVAVDLLDPRASRMALVALGSVDYVFYAALAVRSTPADQVQPNLDMLRNAVTPFLGPASRLRHVCMVHGTKWYGSHLGPYRTPARENDPRHAGPNFYYDQYDWLRAAQQSQTWSRSTLRPHFVNGFNVGNPNNMMVAIGVYAAIQRAQGQPLHFPGTQAAYESLSMITDVSLVNAAMMWTALSPQCANQDFNINNGDFFRWKNLWPSIAAAFDMPAGGVVPLILPDYMADKAAVWEHVVQAHGLRPVPLAQIVSWQWADFFFRGEWDDMSSTLKARQFGFELFIDTEANLLSTLARYRAEKVLP